MAAAWTAVGASVSVTGVGLGLGAWRLGLPNLVIWTFPVVLFALYGAAWSVAFAVKRRASFAWVCAGCYLAAVACGALMDTAWGWLVLSGGLFLLVAAPGFLMLRQARG